MTATTKKYKDMTAEERKTLKAANEAAMPGRNPLPPMAPRTEAQVTKDIKDHNAELARLDRMSRARFAKGLDF